MSCVHVEASLLPATSWKLHFAQNVNMAGSSMQYFCEICQKLRSMTGRRGEEHFNLERTTVSTIFYVFGVAIVCVVSWISVNLRSITRLSTDTASSHEMLTFGERSLRFAAVPNPKPVSTETEASKTLFLKGNIFRLPLNIQMLQEFARNPAKNS